MKNNARTGGILTIISGVFGVLWLVWALFMILMMRVAFSTPYAPFGSLLPAEFFTLMTTFYSIIGAFYFLLGVLGIVGGVFALRKKNWRVALAGAIAGNLTFFPCGIPAIIYVTLAKPEFSAKKPARRRRK
jgi:hypothetical protein